MGTYSSNYQNLGRKFFPQWTPNQRKQSPLVRAGIAGFSLIKFLLIVAILSGALVGCFYIKIQGSSLFPILAIKIASDYHYVSKDLLKKVIASRIKNDNFLTLNINLLKKELLNISWVHDVSIRRVWPGKLFIKIQEQKPLALFNEQGVINEEGNAFYPAPASIPKQLPQILAPLTELETVFEYYQKMTAMLHPFALKIVFLELNIDGNLKVILSNGISLLVGKSNIFMRWERFISAYPKLNQEALSSDKRIGQIDLRYPHGFAVRWTRNLEARK